MNRRVLGLALMVAVLFGGAARADAPDTLVYSGELLEDGVPAEGTFPVRFAVFANAEGGAPLWDESFEVDVVAGRFSVDLAQRDGLAEVFDGSTLHLQITLDGEVLSPRTVLGSVPYAYRAQTAARVDGAIEYDGEASGVDASDVRGALDALASRIAELEAQVRALEGDTVLPRLDAVEAAAASAVATAEGAETTAVAAEVAVAGLAGQLMSVDTRTTSLEGAAAANTTALGAVRTDVDAAAALAANNATALMSLQSDVSAVQSASSAATSRLTALEALTSSMSLATIDGAASLVFEGVNVHVRDGTGSTSCDSGMCNGLGNLVVGYSEGGVDRSGAHNLLVGSGHSYSGFAGLASGGGATIATEGYSLTAGSTTVSGSLTGVRIEGVSVFVDGESSLELSSPSSSLSGDSLVTIDGGVVMIN